MSELDLSGRLGHLTPEQEKALASFKLAVPDFDSTIHDDHALLRFLRARNWNVDQAGTMWNEFIKWRMENDVDTILTKFDFPEYPVGK